MRFVVDPTTHDEASHACRLILWTVREDVHRYEADIPAHPTYPPQVAEAAEVLRGVAVRSGRVEAGGYALTGIIEYDDNRVWSAFVEFAAWAYDATVWNSAGDDIVSLADEGQSIVVQLTPAQRTTIAGELGQGALVPAVNWRASRRRGTVGGGA